MQEICYNQNQYIKRQGVPVMAFKYTEEQLNKLDKELLMMEQIVLSNKSRFGRSSEKMTDPG